MVSGVADQVDDGLHHLPRDQVGTAGADEPRRDDQERRLRAAEQDVLQARPGDDARQRAEALDRQVRQ
ncbi:hypothetical protein D3C72_1758840 [compost metagenome]